MERSESGDKRFAHPRCPNRGLRFRITSVYGQVLITPPIQQVSPDVADTYEFYDLGVQFQPRQYTLGACKVTTQCGNKQLDIGEACEPALQGTNDPLCNPSTCQLYP